MADTVTSARTTNEVPYIWYASYGSNMDYDRFLCYIVGGRPQGSSRSYDGCTDKSLPVAAKIVHLPGQLYFAGDSGVWTGGVAFLSHDAGAEPTKGKAYLITKAQFDEIVAQENLNLQTEYDEIMYCGEEDGFPILSFTSSVEVRPFAKPAPAYLGTIAKGLMMAHDLSHDEASDYLLSKPGITDNYLAHELRHAITNSSFAIAD